MSLCTNCPHNKTDFPVVMKTLTVTWPYLLNGIKSLQPRLKPEEWSLLEQHIDSQGFTYVHDVQVSRQSAGISADSFLSLSASPLKSSFFAVSGCSKFKDARARIATAKDFFSTNGRFLLNSSHEFTQSLNYSVIQRQLYWFIKSASHILSLSYA